MTKEEILEKSRKDNKNVDYYEFEIRNKATVLSSIVGLGLCGILYALLIIIKNEVHAEIFVIMSAMETVLFGYKYIKLRKKHELIVTILYGLTLIFFTILLIRNLIA